MTGTRGSVWAFSEQYHDVLLSNASNFVFAKDALYRQTKIMARCGAVFMFYC